MTFNEFFYYLILGLSISANLISFSLTIFDKKRSIKNKRRVPEGALFLFAIYGGSLGVILGMLLARHKTRKWYFKWGLPFLLIQNIALSLLIWFFLSKNIYI